MCLISKCKVPSISTSEIICYKVLCPIRGRLISPYRAFSFIADKEYKDSLGTIKEKKDGSVVVTSGYFHSYKTLAAARNELDTVNSRTYNRKEHFIYKVRIPVGSEYYEGINSDIASKNIVILEQI